MNKIKLLFTLLSLILVLFVSGQQDSKLDFRPFSDMYDNPASLVNTRMWRANINYRNSLPGFEDGPESYYFGLGGPIGLNKSVSNITYRHAYTRRKVARYGLGAYVIKDTYGHFGYNSYIINYAQRFKLSSDYSFALGLGTGIYNYFIRTNHLNVKYKNDPTYYQYLNGQDRFLLGDLNLGFIFTGRNFQFGFATRHVMNNNVKIGNTPEYAELNETYTAFTKATFRIDPNVIMIPSVEGRYTEGIPYDLKISAPFVFHEMFMAGLGVSMNKSFAVETGVYKRGIFFGYSFTLNTSELSSFSDLSHQLGISYILPVTPKAQEKFSIADALF